jgi:bifunctional pyridoxal-dependent enzyme with beta-cystathionase and maltose regulon repressor activities
MKLGNMCVERDVLVIADEIHSDLIYQSNKHFPFAFISEDFAQKSSYVMLRRRHLTCQEFKLRMLLSQITT